MNPDWVAVKELFDKIIDDSKPARNATKKDTRRSRRRTGNSAPKPYDILDTMEMDIDVQVADTASQFTEQYPSTLPRDADGNIDLSSVPYTAQNWSALLHTPSTSSHRSRSGSLAASSVHGSPHSTPFLRRATFPDTKLSQHADPPRPTPPPLWIDTAFDLTASRSERRENEKAEGTSILPASGLAREAPAPVLASVSAPAPAPAPAAAAGSDDEDDGSYHPDEGDDKDDTSEISSAPPSPGIPEAARELERQYLASQQATPQRSSETTPVSARPPTGPEPNLVSASDMLFTHNALPSPAPPSASSSHRPALRIETAELCVQQPEAPFTTYPAEPEWVQQHEHVAPPQPSVLGLFMDTASDSEWCRISMLRVPFSLRPHSPVKILHILARFRQVWLMHLRIHSMYRRLCLRYSLLPSKRHTVLPVPAITLVRFDLFDASLHQVLNFMSHRPDFHQPIASLYQRCRRDDKQNQPVAQFHQGCRTMWCTRVVSRCAQRRSGKSNRPA